MVSPLGQQTLPHFACPSDSTIYHFTCPRTTQSPTFYLPLGQHNFSHFTCPSNSTIYPILPAFWIAQSLSFILPHEQHNLPHFTLRLHNLPHFTSPQTAQSPPNFTLRMHNLPVLTAAISSRGSSQLPRKVYRELLVSPFHVNPSWCITLADLLVRTE